MSDSIRVLHLFESYLSLTKNWAFSLIDNLPDTKVIIASKHFQLCNFYSSKFEYIEFPLKIFNNPKGVFWLKVINKIISAFLKLYPWYVLKTCKKCDLMHSHFATVGWEYLWLAKKLRIPHVVSFYGYDYESLPFRNPVWKRRYLNLFKKADLFLCEGSHGVKILRKAGCPPQKIMISRLGVNINNIPFWKHSKKPGELNLLQIAAFKEKKGQKFAVEAFQIALKDCTNMTLTFVGPDRRKGLKAKIERKTINTPAEGKVFFLETVDFDSLYTFMKDYHVFIHPSCYTDQMNCEGGAPVVLLDTQATGMPVISTTHCDIPDEVIHGKTGLLSPEKDSISLAKSIENFYYLGQEDYDSFAQNARKHVERNYDVKVNSAKLRLLYDELMNNVVGNQFK